MTYDSERASLSREHIYIVEIDLDYCTLTYGVLPCTASQTGDNKCFNTKATSDDLANYTPGIKTYRFCENRSPHPIGLDAIPCLQSVSLSPAELDVKGGLGTRASASLTFNDLPHDDNQFGIDKYLADRTYIASERGTFWTKLRARNPNYQYRELRVLSGYIVDGKYDAANFTTRYYVIEKMDVSRGQATISAKDTLKLASANKAQVPKPNTGQLSGALTTGSTSLTLTITGSAADAEYGTSGEITIDREVMTYTRTSGSNVMTITRAQRNTIAAAHSANATVQEAYVVTAKQVYEVVEDLLVNFAGVSASFVPTAPWKAEDDTYLGGLIEGIITKPQDVNKTLIELAESVPHYLWWDERTQLVQFTALKNPPAGANVLNMSDNLLADSVNVTDQPDMRVSTVFVNYAIFDPTKKLDEPNNFEQSVVRVDVDSIDEFTTNQIKVINSRWISKTNKAAALRAAALVGRRFADIPREISFSLDAKDADTWAGQTKFINHRDMLDQNGSPVDTLFQITSVREKKDIFDYSALEFKYGAALQQDEGGGDPSIDLVIISTNDQNINLRSIYDGLYPAPDASTIAKFVVDPGVVIGSTAALEGLDTGSWPSGATVQLQLNSGSYVVGKGGDGGVSGGNGGAGGKAIKLNHDLELLNSGIIGGGGGGGGSGFSTGISAGGGGGAGSNVGLAGTSSGAVLVRPASAGTLTGGGIGAIVNDGAEEPTVAIGGTGGDLGVAGSGGTGGSSGGAAGVAIDKNGYTLTQTISGTILGSILA